MIVIPMGGRSSRFFERGYQRPKYELMAHGRSLFWHAVSSFARYFDRERFVFIVRPDYQAIQFVSNECQRLGIRDYFIVELENETRGQADTVRLGLIGASARPDESVTIFNIDTIRPGFEFPSFVSECDGYLEVFPGLGQHWSFVEPLADDGNRVRRTTEKVRISDLCSTGLYYFRRPEQFLSICAAEMKKDLGELVNGEVYVAPLYNQIIESGGDVRFNLIGKDEVYFCGTPDEYTGFLTVKF